MKHKFSLTIICSVFLCANVLAQDDEQVKVLSFEKFIFQSTQNDTEFESILLDTLSLKYQDEIRLPSGDLILSVKQQHEFFLNQDRDSPDTTVELSKLFPVLGTELTADYANGASLTSAADTSSAGFTLTQPIAENAFGQSTRLLKKIVGLEVDVASHQVIEAYEDYLAAVMTAYYTWYEDYENLKIGRSSYQENLKLLENMNERQKQKIALPIDVNKVKIQVLSKKERLIELEEQYQNSMNVIRRMIRLEDDMAYIPTEPPPPAVVAGNFDHMFYDFVKLSRTFEILKKLEEKSTLQVKRDANSLLPSIDIIAGYEVSGDDHNLADEEDFAYAGISLEWPFFEQVDRAEYKVSKIEERQQKLTSTNTYWRLYTQLRNLFLQLEREKQLIDIAQERIDLAQAILDDESENYSFGKVTLNDYIQAFNSLDNNKFNKISHDALYNKLLVEWLRLNDKLVTKKELADQVEKLEVP